MLAQGKAFGPLVICELELNIFSSLLFFGVNEMNDFALLACFFGLCLFFWATWVFVDAIIARQKRQTAIASCEAGLENRVRDCGHAIDTTA